MKDMSLLLASFLLQAHSCLIHQISLLYRTSYYALWIFDHQMKTVDKIIALGRQIFIKDIRQKENPFLEGERWSHIN